MSNINNFYRGEMILSRALSFHFVAQNATKRRLSFSPFSFCCYIFFIVCVRLIIASSFPKRFLFEKAHSLLNAAGRDGFSFGDG